MKIDEILQTLDGMSEQLAAVEHERWSHWQRYMHEQGQKNSDGSLIIPAELVQRWERQMNTKYVDLDDAEKKSDLDQVKKYLPLIKAAFCNGK